MPKVLKWLVTRSLSETISDAKLVKPVVLAALSRAGRANISPARELMPEREENTNLVRAVRSRSRTSA
jgi:hypothetical protein